MSEAIVCMTKKKKRKLSYFPKRDENGIFLPVWFWLSSLHRSDEKEGVELLPVVTMMA